MEQILEKLSKVDGKATDAWEDWTNDEKKQLLELYWLLSKKEHQIFKLIYGFHGCDTWEDIFRDFDRQYLHEKAVGVELAIETLVEYMNKK